MISSVLKNSSRWFFPGIIALGYVILYLVIKDKLLLTPDFAASDALHFNTSNKYFLWKSIRAGTIPIWTNLLDGGYPLLAESQMGMLFLPYYLIFPLFSSFSHAYTFLFCLHLFLLTVGMYTLQREYKVPQALAFFLSISFAWSGAITFRWVHFTVLQAFSFFPILFFIYVRWEKTRSAWYLIIFSLLLSQMVFVGYIQVVFMSLLALSLFYVLNNYPIKVKKTLLFCLSIIGGIALSLPQLLPTLQLSRYAQRPLANTYDFAVSIPFAFKNLCSFINPYCLGSPRAATHSFDWRIDGIYWENTPYMGIIFLVLLSVSSMLFFIYKIYKKRGVKEMGVILSLIIIFILLALGKHSPLYFVFSIFPFTMFRTPPRFLLPATFFIILLAGLIIKKIIGMRPYFSYIIYFFLALNCIHLVYIAFSYHLFVDASKLYRSLQYPRVAIPVTRSLSPGALEYWFALFKREGWSSKTAPEKYLFLSQARIPNSNLMSDSSVFGSYVSLPIRRHTYTQSLINEGVLSGNAGIEPLLDVFQINTIFSFTPLLLPHFLAPQISNLDQHRLYVYQRPLTRSYFYIPRTVQKVAHMEDITTFSMTNAIAEDIVPTKFTNSSSVTISPPVTNDLHIHAQVNTKKSTFIVCSINWYPEWRLKIDGKEAPIYKTNLLHMGFIVPQGTHSIDLTYVPVSLYWGLFIAALSLIGTAFFALKITKRGK